MSPDDCSVMVGRIQDGDGAAGEDLYQVISQVVMGRFCRCGTPRADAEDSAHDTFLIVLGAIQSGELREPGRLMGFLKVVVHRQVAGHVTSTARARQRWVSVDDVSLRDRGDPEHEVIDHELLGMVHRALAGMKPQYREVISRSYLREQPNARIRSDMALDERQFRNLKHYALTMLRKRVRRAARVAA